MLLLNKLLSIINGYKLSYIFFLAHKIELFSYLEKPITLFEISSASGANLSALKILLNILSSLEIVKLEDGKYTLSDDAKKLLSADSNLSILPLLECEAYLSGRYTDYDAVEKAFYGKGRDVFNNNCKDGLSKLYGTSMDNGNRLAATLVAKYFMRNFSGRIVDIGGGIGTFAITICRFNKNVEIVIFDREDMREHSVQNIKQNNLQERIKFYPIDIVKESFLGRYNGAIISNVLHLFDIDTNKNILKKTTNVLENGGKFVLHDFFLDDSKMGPYLPILFSIDWLILGAYFDASRKDIAEWLKPLNVTVLEHKKYTQIPTSIITAIKNK